MDINFYRISAPKTSAVPAQAEAARRGYEAEARATAGSEHTDTVTISSQGSRKRDAARIARGVMKDIGRTQQDDAARIADIRQRVANQTYSVSTGAVADAILSSALGW